MTNLKKCTLFIVLFIALYTHASGQNIKPSASSSQNDFDFLEGKWKVQNRMLNGKNEWVEFEAELHMRKTLNGLGNVENYYSTFNGKPFEGMAVRLFNPKTRLWSVYWMDSNFATMDGSPVTGSFENKLGKLYASGEADGKTIISLYQWDASDPEHPKWAQASSSDNGKTWDWNWYMTLTRIK
ncbi:MAG TPA: hypothetical protein PKC54_12900 [Ferruginibacter sp.]|nr:hypothetical protein [Ferruginibacter sp.]